MKLFLTTSMTLFYPAISSINKPDCDNTLFNRLPDTSRTESVPPVSLRLVTTGFPADPARVRTFRFLAGSLKM